MSNVHSATDEARALRLIVEGTAGETGTGFFRALVKNLAAALGTSGAWVTEYFPKEQKLRALAMWLKGDFVEHYEYAITDTVVGGEEGLQRVEVSTIKRAHVVAHDVLVGLKWIHGCTNLMPWLPAMAMARLMSGPSRRANSSAASAKKVSKPAGEV